MAKTDEQLISEIYDLLMETMLPERTSEFRVFDENGKQIVLQRIVYKAGGFDIKERWFNPDYHEHIERQS